jgi:hypothetical protein
VPALSVAAGARAAGRSPGCEGLAGFIGGLGDGQDVPGGLGGDSAQFPSFVLAPVTRDLASLRGHPTGPTQTAPYSVAEYKNIAGRAGRLGLSDGGRAVLIVGGGIDRDRRWRDYVLGKPEDLRSQLLDPEQDLATLILRVVAVASRREGVTGLSEAEVIAFLSNS